MDPAEEQLIYVKEVATISGVSLRALVRAGDCS